MSKSRPLEQVGEKERDNIRKLYRLYINTFGKNMTKPMTIRWVQNAYRDLTLKTITTICDKKDKK